MTQRVIPAGPASPPLPSHIIPKLGITTKRSRSTRPISRCTWRVPFCSFLVDRLRIIASKWKRPRGMPGSLPNHVSSRLSMPEQKLLGIEQRPLHVFPGLALVGGLADVFQHGLDFGFLRRPGERGQVNLLEHGLV